MNNEVLNPVLYRRLLRAFGRVRVSKRGEAFISQVRHTEAGDMTQVIQAGEYYQVCCPFCQDTNFHLYINHMFGQKDAYTGKRMRFLAICFRGNCLSSPENRDLLLERLETTPMELQEAEIRPGIRVLPTATVEWPGECVPVDLLPKTHRACVYLRSRAFDPKEIGRKYRVHYCLDSKYSLVRGRLIIPIFSGSDLVGWQARFVGELPWKDPQLKNTLPPKYFSCPNSHFRSRAVYNLDRMRQWHTGVIVEGPTDVWRFGSMAGCVFGNTVTETQKEKLLVAFRDRTLVLLLDPEEFDKPTTKRTADFFRRRMSGRFCAIQLPTGTDPGALQREYLRDYVRKEAAKQGVKVVYRRLRNGQAQA